MDGQKTLSFRLLVGLCALTVTACAGKRAPDPALTTRPPAESGSSEQVTPADLNRDGKPDVWTYSLPSPGPDGKVAPRVVRKELDLNWDGKLDITRHYGERGEIDREALDLDFDGKVDQVNVYAKGVIAKKERDSDGNGVTDEWLHYEKGRMVRRERDGNQDGRIDYWEYWEADQIDRIGEDLDGDGNVDRWTKGTGS